MRMEGWSEEGCCSGIRRGACGGRRSGGGVSAAKGGAGGSGEPAGGSAVSNSNDNNSAAAEATDRRQRGGASLFHLSTDASRNAGICVLSRPARGGRQQNQGRAAPVHPPGCCPSRTCAGGASTGLRPGLASRRQGGCRGSGPGGPSTPTGGAAGRATAGSRRRRARASAETAPARLKLAGPGGAPGS